MKISLTFVEYAAVNSIREVGPVAFALISNAKLSKAGGERTWMLDGDLDAFGSLLANVRNARSRTLSVAMSEALAGVSKAIEVSQTSS